MSNTSTMIHPSALIDPSAKVASDVKIGPWSIIGPNVEIGEGTEIGAHVYIKCNTKVGKNNKVYPYSILGEDPQDLKFKGGDTWLEIGDENIIREYCSIHRGANESGAKTIIGNKNFIMAYVHIAHDCLIKDEITFVNNTSLGGHVRVESYARIGGHVGVHQFCTIGSYSLVTAAMIGKDVPPYVIVTGNTAYVCGVNTVGLKRRGFSADAISGIRQAYSILFRKGATLAQAAQELAEMTVNCPEVQLFLDAINNSNRGILR